MRVSIVVAITLCGGVVAGCSQDAVSNVTRGRAGCEVATAQAVAAGQADARQFALGALKYELQDLKGYMLKSGYRTARARTAPTVVCKPYPLSFGTGLRLCVATGQLCSP
jgi:hypothetical protein